LEGAYIEGLFGLGGIILGGVVTYFLKDNKIGLDTRMKVIHESLDAMKSLLSKMSSAKNKINYLIQDIEKNKSFNADFTKEAMENMTDCVKYFEEHRAELFIFIAKDESPLFIDYAIALKELIEHTYNNKNLEYREQIIKSNTTFINLYNEYTKNYTNMIDIVINKKRFH